MLKQRVLTALALLPPVLATIFFAPTVVLYGVFGAVGLLVAWEWTALMALSSQGQRWVYLLCIGLLMVLAWVQAAQAPWLFGLALAWWCVAFFLLLRLQIGSEMQKPRFWAMAVLGPVLIVPAMYALAFLHQRGASVLLFALVLVWMADIGAYFAGRGFGRHKLAPRISPGKTWEGAVGGVLLSIVWAAVAGTQVLPQISLSLLVGLSVAVVFFSIVGDLTESAFKRWSGVKDSGSILPGHGGILDRTDSLLAAMPVFALGLIWISNHA